MVIDILFAVGLSYLIVQARPIEILRNKFITNKLLTELLTCPYCTSFWVGVITSLFIYNFNPFLIKEMIYFTVLTTLTVHIVEKIE